MTYQKGKKGKETRSGMLPLNLFVKIPHPCDVWCMMYNVWRPSLLFVYEMKFFNFFFPKVKATNFKWSSEYRNIYFMSGSSTWLYMIFYYTHEIQLWGFVEICYLFLHSAGIDQCNICCWWTLYSNNNLQLTTLVLQPTTLF